MECKGRRPIQIMRTSFSHGTTPFGTTAALKELARALLDYFLKLIANGVETLSMKANILALIGSAALITQDSQANGQNRCWASIPPWPLQNTSTERCRLRRQEAVHTSKNPPAGVVGLSRCSVMHPRSNRHLSQGMDPSSFGAATSKRR